MATPTLPLTTLISQSSSRKRTYRTLSAQYGSGYQQDAPDSINNIVDTWSIRFDVLKQADRDALVAFLDSVGGWTSWTWQAPGDAIVKTWKITADGWSETAQAGNVYAISFTAKQVF